MSTREEEAFKSWVAEYANSITEDGARDAFHQFVESDAGLDLYRGTLREKKLYTELNKIADDRKELEGAQQELAEWWENEEPIRQQLLTERDELRKQTNINPGGGEPPNAVTGITPEEVALLKSKADKVDAIDRMLPDVIGQYGAALMDAQKNNFDVDANEIMQTSIAQGIPPYRAYELLTSTQRKERAGEVEKEREAKWFEEGRRAALSGDAPDHIQPSGPSIFDSLTAPEPSSETSVPLTGQRRVADAVRQFRESDF